MRRARKLTDIEYQTRFDFEEQAGISWELGIPLEEGMTAPWEVWPGGSQICWMCGQGYIVCDGGFLATCRECDSVVNAYEAKVQSEHLRRHFQTEETSCVPRDCRFIREIRQAHPSPYRKIAGTNAPAQEG